MTGGGCGSAHGLNLGKHEGFEQAQRLKQRNSTEESGFFTTLYLPETVEIDKLFGTELLQNGV
jgi:hypothetical protein